MKIPTDKLLHFSANFIICMVFSAVFVWVDAEIALFIAVMPCVVASVGKELYDLVDYGHFCLPDILADALGMVAAVVCVAVFRFC